MDITLEKKKVESLNIFTLKEGGGALNNWNAKKYIIENVL